MWQTINSTKAQRLYHWKPVFGDKLHEAGIGRYSGAQKGLKKREGIGGHSRAK